MVIGLFIIAAIPTVTGVCQAVSAQQNQEKREKDERRMRKFNIDVECDGTDSNSKIIQDGRVVVKNERLWIGPSGVDEEGDYGYVSECMIIEYPDAERIPVPLGLVSQVRQNPPLLTWIYVDKNTMELKYGNKSSSIAHHVGTWDWTEDEQYLTLEDEYGNQEEDFIAVRNQPVNCWQLFYNMDGATIEKVVPQSWPKLRVRLRRTLSAEA